MTRSPRAVASVIDDVEAEMKRLGAWDLPEPSPEAIANGGAFGANTMALEQWLRFIFIPNVRKLLASGGPFPSESHVGHRAFREFEDQEGRDGLVALLNEFDSHFGPG